MLRLLKENTRNDNLLTLLRNLFTNQALETLVIILNYKKECLNFLQYFEYY